MIIYLQVCNYFSKILHLFYGLVLWFILPEVRKNRTGDTIVIVTKNKISKNIRIYLNKFSGYVCAVLCVSLFVLRLLISFRISWRSTWEQLKTKRQTRVPVFLYCNYAVVEPIFHDCFHQRITFIVTHWFRFIILENI